MICIAAYALRFPRLPRPAAQNVNWLARQPKRELHRLEHRKLIVLAQNLVPLKYRWRFHDCYFS
jgi:hypothetical protein